jgi:RimJ/RimL family protein N-acetyltransferase
LFRTLSETREVAELALDDLSDWFNPYLPYFLRETLRSGGEVTVSSAGGAVDGLCLYNPTERVASIFTRSEEIARAMFERRSGISVFSEAALGPIAESYRVYSVELDRWASDHRFTHPVRPARASDLPAVRRLLLDVYGAADERWFATMPSTTERWFLVELDGKLAGTACASLVGRHGRLHSLSVAPTRRRLGIGSDLVFARLVWLRAAGARSVLSEISERNLPSRALAEGAGMRDVGRLFRYERPAVPSEPVAAAAPA